MIAVLLLLCAGVGGYSGFACLALAMPEHWERAGGNPDRQAPRARALRRCGAAMLSLAFAVCVWRDGAAFGTLLWAILMSASALAVAFTLTWYPQLMRYAMRSSMRAE